MNFHDYRENPILIIGIDQGRQCSASLKPGLSEDSIKTLEDLGYDINDIEINLL